jgi:hypothetical protein
MTRKQLLANARTFLIAGGVSLLLVLGTPFLTKLFGHKAEMYAMALNFILAFIVMGGVFGGLYFLVRGLLRSKDWRPSATDWAIKGYSPERDIKKLRKMIKSEVEGTDAAALRITHQPADLPPPQDLRSPLRQFMESTSPVHVQHHLFCVVPIKNREVVVLVQIGRGTESPDMAHWVGITMSTPCQTDLSQPVIWTKHDKAFSGEPQVTSHLNGSQPLSKVLGRLIQHVYHEGATISRSDSAFILLPEDHGALAQAQTLPQEYKGGFVIRLGLNDFVEAVELVEQIR